MFSRCLFLHALDSAHGTGKHFAPVGEPSYGSDDPASTPTLLRPSLSCRLPPCLGAHTLPRLNENPSSRSAPTTSATTRFNKNDKAPRKKYHEVCLCSTFYTFVRKLHVFLYTLGALHSSIPVNHSLQYFPDIFTFFSVPALSQNDVWRDQRLAALAPSNAGPEITPTAIQK